MHRVLAAASASWTLPGCSVGAEPALAWMMKKYFLGQSVLRGSWDQVFAASWQQYPNPYSKHTNRMLPWAKRLFLANVTHSVYILEDSIVDLQNQTMTTFTWNINHTRLMVVEERCVYCVNSDNRLDRNPPGSLGVL
ncbi:PRELI domain-containing protein 1, mitochondrial [Tupaia chinensis]|uniref:PRELI domain-containing protein 1, mitochondrial n=1 Tax=Tupaia chinensis TaxID=246437 RepID=L9JH97_TUPCH|nr:PRELI domain-containing protein 1, mitochondrial [Tupaia chinensis]